MKATSFSLQKFSLCCLEATPFKLTPKNPLCLLILNSKLFLEIPGPQIIYHHKNVSPLQLHPNDYQFRLMSTFSSSLQLASHSIISQQPDVPRRTCKWHLPTSFRGEGMYAERVFLFIYSRSGNCQLWEKFRDDTSHFTNFLISPSTFCYHVGIF